MDTSIALISGQYFDYLNPDPDVITLEVIAHALSHTGRYSGHTSRFYSVAEHSIRCFEIDPTPETLMHDASEAFMVDLPTPLKRLLPDYKRMEHELEYIIAQKFGLPFPMTAATRRADLVMLATEKRDLLPECGEWPVLAGIEPLAGRISLNGRTDSFVKDTFLRLAKQVGL